jgi:hypothetical protein
MALKAGNWILAVALLPPAFAQKSVNAWENLSALKPGDKIQVVQKDMKSWSGAFAAVSDESISLKTKEGDKSVSRAAVMRVSRHGGRRVRHALIGAAIVGGVGVAVGAGAGGSCGMAFGPCFSRGLLAGMFGGAGAVVGAGAGAAIPGSIVLYRAP